MIIMPMCDNYVYDLRGYINANIVQILKGGWLLSITINQRIYYNPFAIANMNYNTFAIARAKESYF